MRAMIGIVVVAGLLGAVATEAAAQRRGAAPQAPGVKHEFGIDIGLAYALASDLGGVDVGSGLRVGMPLDVRLGWVPRGKLMFEGRVSIQADGIESRDLYLVTAGANVVYPFGKGTHRRGTYLTGGAAVLLTGVQDQSGTGFSLNGAIGTRKPIGGNAAFRFEGGVRYDTEVEDVFLPATLNIGGRVGISFWH